MQLSSQSQACPRLRLAKLRHHAVPEDVDYRSERGLDRALFMKLIAGDWINAHDNLATCDFIGHPTYADAILDRLVHNAHRIDLSGDSLRRNQPRKS
jgi:hypothetical protein